MPLAYPPIPFAENVETIPLAEAHEIQQVIEAMQQILARSQARSGEFRADVHVKTHGYAKGKFHVLPDLPAELSQGLFEQDCKYPAVVRFSNAAPHVQPDAVPDGRGMAIKVLGVNGDMLDADDQEGQTQDFIMINHPVFFARDVKDFLRLEQVLVQADNNPFATLQGTLTGDDWNPLNWHWREVFTAARIAGHLPAHLASYTYFSMAPVRFGNYVAKYRAVPAGDLDKSCLDLILKFGLSADAMRLTLEETLRIHSLRFEFQVQLRTSDRTMPVEDATVEWPESESPYQTVAHLVLPVQEIASLRDDEACNRLSFNVWHALAAHRPLGGINRVRRLAYPVSSAWRNQHSAIVTEKPRSADEIC